MLKKIIYLLCLISMASCYCQYENKADSLKYELKKYEAKQLQLGKKNADLSDSVKVNLLIALSLRSFGRDANDAEKYTKAALNLATKIKFNNGIAMANHYLGRFYTDRGEHQRAIDYTNKSIALFKKAGNKTNLSDAYNELGILFSKLGNYPEAIKNYHAALHIYELQNNKLYIASTYVNIGLIYKQQENYDKALDNYFKVLNIVKNDTTDDGDYTRAFTFNNMGHAYLKQKKVAKALEYLQKAITIGNQFNDPSFNADTDNGLGNCYFLMNDFPKALQLYQKALALFEQNKDLVGISESLINIGATELKIGNYSKAIDYTKRGLKIAKTNGQIESIKKGYQNLAASYSQTNNYKLAFENQVLFKQINDSMFNSEKNKKFTELQLTYEFEKKQKDIRLQQIQKENLLKLETKKQKTTIYFVLIALILVTIFAVWVYYNLKQNQKQKNTIEDQNLVIKNALSEKEVLMREIYHRVKNNLQFVAAMIQMQIKTAKDTNEKSVLKDTSRRINAMTLVHEMLYNKDQLESVSLKIYLTELVEKLNELVNDSHLPIQFKLDIQDVNFNINNCMAIGMITSELLSNAIKYAFSDIKKPQIDITLHYDKNSKNITYKVSDNGIGFENNTTSGLGLRLIDIFTRQLKGTFEIQNNKGCQFTFEFLHQY